MKLKTLHTITAVFFIVNASIALITPGTQLSLYGVQSGPGANYMAQWAGLGSVVVALVAWFARNLTDPKANRDVLLTLTIYFILGTIVSVLGVVSGIMKPIGWSLAAICTLFAAGYASFLFNTRS